MCAKAVAEFAGAKERGYYSIGPAAELSGVTAKMIRHYESVELIPKAARTLGDYRVYTASDIHTLRFIRRARRLGFSTDEIGTLLSLWQNERRASKEVKRLALKHVAELDSKIEELQLMRRRSPISLRTVTAISDLSARFWTIWDVYRPRNEYEARSRFLEREGCKRR